MIGVPLITTSELTTWVHDAEPGARKCYFVGNLPRARNHLNSGGERTALAFTADALLSLATALYEQGIVSLVHSTLEHDLFAYFVCKVKNGGSTALHETVAQPQEVA